MQTHQGTVRGSTIVYLLAFIATNVLTVVAYWITKEHLFSTWVLNSLLALFAIVATWIQFVIFLNLGGEDKPRWNLFVFFFTIMVTLILVFGSLWIMYNLNYNLMMME